MSWDKGELVPLRALANPLRMRIVSLLTGTAMSATEVAEELGIAHGSASYHLRQLHTAGYLRRVDDQPARAGRGQPRRRYQYDHAAALRLDRSDSQPLVRETMFADLRRRAQLISRDHRTADAEVWLDRDTWDEVCTLVDRAIDLVHEKAGPPRAGGSVKVSMTAMLWELADSR